MTRTLLKSLLAAAVAVTTLAPVAGAHDTRLMLKRAIDGAPMFSASQMRRTFDMRQVSRTPVQLKLVFDCEVAGTPVEFPNDIRITNPYNFTVSAGTVAAYSAPFGNTGTVVLPQLAPGAGVYVSNAIPGGVTAGAPCSATSV